MIKSLSIVLTLLLFASCASDEVEITWRNGQVSCNLSASDQRFIYSVDDSANVNLTCNYEEGKEPVIRLKGSSTGSFTYKADIKSTVILDGLQLSATVGNTPVSLKNKKRSLLVLQKGTVSRLSDAPQQHDTLASKDCLRCKGKLTIAGEGELQLLATHVGSKGLKCGKDFVMQSGTLTVNTSGMYLYEDTMPQFPGPPPGMMGEMPDFSQMPDFSAMMPPMGNGGPMGPPPGNMGGPMGPPPGGMGGPMGFPGFEGDSTMMPKPFERHNYKGTAKGLKISGTFTMSGGSLNVTTTTPGAEGLEAKEGVTISGGQIHIEAYDDGISTSGPILVDGGDTYVKSLHNDGIDTNYGKGGYTQHAGKVEVATLAGPPEEGLDTDWTPIVHDGGELIGKQELQNGGFPFFQPQK